MAARTIGRRRSLNAVAWAVGAILVGVLALVAAAVGSPGERIAGMWVGAELRADGTAKVTEVIDYVFTDARHGIYREVPGAEAADSESVSVTMDGAPVEFDVDDSLGTTRIQIGDPDGTVTGAHRYRIEYTLPELGDPDLLAWDAVGTDWEVPIERAEVHLTAPSALGDPICYHGVSGSEDSCVAEQPSPGRLDAVLDDLDAEEGLTIYAEILVGTPTDVSPLPAAPTGPAPVIEPGDSVLVAGALAALAALVAAAVIALVFRVLGRTRVESIDGMARRRDLGRVDVEPSYRPPSELGPAQAGVLYTDKVRAEHQAAWILGAGLDGHVSVKGSKDKPSIRLLPGSREVDGPTGEILGALFARNTTVKLGKYSKTFATAWKLIRTELRKWRRGGGDGLWQPWGTPVRWAAMGIGALAAAAGALVLAIAATGVTEAGSGWRDPVIAGAAAAGAGIAAFICAWELRVRTPRGGRLWCETEAYRRYLATLTHDAWAEGTGEVITAWAVALRETAPVLTAAKAPKGKSSPGYQPEPALFLTSSASHSTSPPSSGGSGSGSSGYSGGGDSGGSGGGDGGGGGGSW